MKARKARTFTIAHPNARKVLFDLTMLPHSVGAMLLFEYYDVLPASQVMFLLAAFQRTKH